MELLSNGDWTLRFEGKGGRRATENYMHRVFGSHRSFGGGAGGSAGGAEQTGGEATPALGGGATGAGGCDCVLTLRNTQQAGEPFARAKINGLVAGGALHIGWANRFHMGLNRNVLSG